MASNETEEIHDEIESLDETIMENQFDEVFECSECNMSFSNIDEHLRNYHAEDPETVKDEDEEAIEYEVVEFDDKVVEDDQMNEEETETAFVIKNTAGKFECKHCHRSYKSLKRYLEHIKVHGDVADDDINKLEEYLKQLEEHEEIYEVVPSLNDQSKMNFRCVECNTMFDSRKKMLLHFPIHRNVELAHSKNRDLIPIESLCCKLCNRSLNNLYELEMHMNAHNENSSAQGSKKIVKKTSPARKKKGEDGKMTYPCQYCDKEFKRPHEKVKHERVHTGEKPYSCDICGKQFRVTYCLSLHKRNVHSDERPYVCSYEGCSKRFKSQSVYNHHLNTHGTAKPYQCTFCAKSFKTSVQLAGHKNTHTKPFSCQVCSRAFASLYAVKIHTEIHKNLDVNLKYTCKICNAQYGRSFALNDHLKTAHPGMLNETNEDDEEEVYEESQPAEEEIYSVVMVPST